MHCATHKVSHTIVRVCLKQRASVVFTCWFVCTLSLKQQPIFVEKVHPRKRQGKQAEAEIPFRASPQGGDNGELGTKTRAPK